MLQRIWAVIQKELIQNLRDSRTLVVVILTPLLQLLLFGYVVHTTINHIPTVVADQSLDAASRNYLDALQGSGYFDIVAWEPSPSVLVHDIDQSRARAGIVIPPDFAAHIARGDAEVLFYVDGSDMFTSQSAFSSASLISQDYAVRLTLQSQTLPVSTGGLNTHTIILYNPDMKDLWFIIPGMIAMLLQQECILLTALAVVRERENGTLEQILVTPIRPLELLLGKIVPNLLIVLANIVTILAVSVLWFGMPFRGNFALFLALAFLFSLAGLGLGLLVSTAAQNQRQAQQLSMVFSMIGMILGGVFFPRYTMPAVIQGIGNIFPVTYFVPISRGVITKGIGMEFLSWEVLSLGIYVVIILFISARAFRQRLD